MLELRGVNAFYGNIQALKNGNCSGSPTMEPQLTGE